jgi:hypothetical protein
MIKTLEPPWVRRAILALISFLIVMLGAATLFHGKLEYYNWWGGIIFAPFAIIIGSLGLHPLWTKRVSRRTRTIPLNPLGLRRSGQSKLPEILFSRAARLTGREGQGQITLRAHIPCGGIMLAMECSVTLRNAIEGLYAASSDYPLPKFTDPCLHCHSLEDEAKLRSAPLREIDSDHLRDYAVDALLVWGDVPVFKHFLPRIFELSVSTPHPAIVFADPEVMFSKFRHAAWRT